MKHDFFTKSKIALALVFSGIFEWYCFILFSHFFTAEYRRFFPASLSLQPIDAAIGLFFLGLVLRPIGGILFAQIGDRGGRLKGLLSSLWLILGATFVLGWVPTYASVGLLSSGAIIMVRLLQGLSAGGMMPMAYVFASEFADEGKRGVWACLPYFGAIIGALLAESVSFYAIPNASGAFGVWVWRIPFLINLVFILLLYRFWKNVSENQHYLFFKNLQTATKNPLSTTFKSHKKNLLLCFFLCAVIATTAYEYRSYVSVFFTTEAFSYLSQSAFFLGVYLSIVVLLVLIPLMAWLSDKLGRKTVILFGIAGLVIDAYPAHILFQQNDFLLTVLAENLLALLSACVIGPMPAYLSEIFPTSVRCTALSISYNMGFLVFGSLAAFFATRPNAVLILSGTISLIALCLLPETFRINFKEDVAGQSFSDAKTGKNHAQ